MAGCNKVTQNFGLEDNTPVTLKVPPGVNYGCNPAAANLATVTSIYNSVTATDDRGNVSYTVTHLATIKGCLGQDVFTIIATGTCGQTATAYVTNTWTVNTTPPALGGVPAGGNLACNPTTLPTDSSVLGVVKASTSCSTAVTSLVVSHTDAVSGCITTRTFTIAAADACGNKVSQTVVFTWTTDTTPPVISGLPAGGNLGLNPALLPSIASISNYSTLRVTDACGGKPAYTVTASGITNACAATCTFTIIATDDCNNSVTQQVTYTWTYDSGPTVTCPPNVTIATNYTPIYCTFTCSDWCSSCNPSGTPPTWWINWDQQNHGDNCLPSWQSWWTSCTGNNPGTSFWNFCQNQQPGDNGSHWWGGSCNPSSAPGWCASYNFGNPNDNWWVPCNGNNPGSVLNNCFGTVYSGGFVQVGLPNGNSVKLTSCSAVRQCLEIGDDDRKL